MFRAITILMLVSMPFVSFSQDSLSYAEQLKILEDEMDSLTIFNLIDSLFSMEYNPTSELNVRIGFTSNVTSSGRDYNLNQTGISPGISYYHKSGIYSDVAGYWNSGADPNYNPTVLSVGYLGTFKNPKWSYSVDGERWFYNPTDSSENPLKHSFGTSISYDFKIGFASIDYSFLFGETTANRIITNLSGSIDLGKWWVFKSISLFPSVSTIVGNSDITQLRISNRQISDRNTERISKLTSFEGLTQQQKKFIGLIVIRAFRNGTISEVTRNNLLVDLSRSSILSDESISGLNEITEGGYEITEYVGSNEFGVLNYAFTLPLSLATNRFYFLISYTYTIPVKLPGEFIEVDPVGYFGASISYRIPFK
ncbi:TorF family putative porin [Ekhidna sp.]